MNKLSLHLEHCRGIKKLKGELDFGKSNYMVIYASNGTMKTSFTGSLKDLSEKKVPKDRYNPGLKSICSIKKSCGTEIKPEEILAISSEIDVDEKELLVNSRDSILVAEPKLRGNYLRVTKELSKAREDLLKGISEIMGYSRSRPIANTIDDLEKDFGKDFEHIVANIHQKLLSDKNARDTAGRYKIYPNYRELLKDNNIAEVAKIDNETLDNYIETYNKLLEKSQYLHKDIFNHYNLKQVGESLTSQSFFKADHSITLNPKSKENEQVKVIKGDKANDILIELIEREKRKVQKSKELQEALDKIDDRLNKRKGDRAIRDILAKHSDLVGEARDLQKFKENLWLCIFNQVDKELNEYIKVYEESEKKVSEIVNKAKTEITRWESVIKEFNSRFRLPLEVFIENKADAVLKQDKPLLRFRHFDKYNDNGIVDESLLNKTLSRGEQRALFFLDVLYKLELNKEKARMGPHLLVLDDIVDSFDYENKYAIVQYLKEINESGLYKIIILTHNFDFYRTISKRLGAPYSNSRMVRKTNDGIFFIKGQYIKNVFNSWLKDIFRDETIMMAAIPFARNIAEYLKRDKTMDEAYQKLTSMLHIKPNTYDLTLSDLERIYADVLKCDSEDKKVKERDRIVVKVIRNLADKIADNDKDTSISDIKLENKVVLSMAARLVGEKYLYCKMPDLDKKVERTTGELVGEFRRRFPRAEKQIISVLDRLCIITPENIHLNSFMYEPLIDVGIQGLMDLYKDIRELGKRCSA